MSHVDKIFKKLEKQKWNEAKRRRRVVYLKSLPQVGKIYRKVDVKEKFHHRKNKRIKETIYTGKKKQKHFVQLNLRNRKKNIN